MVSRSFQVGQFQRLVDFHGFLQRIFLLILVILIDELNLNITLPFANLTLIHILFSVGLSIALISFYQLRGYPEHLSQF